MHQIEVGVFFHPFHNKFPHLKPDVRRLVSLIRMGVRLSALAVKIIEI